MQACVPDAQAPPSDSGAASANSSTKLGAHVNWTSILSAARTAWMTAAARFSVTARSCPRRNFHASIGFSICSRPASTASTIHDLMKQRFKVQSVGTIGQASQAPTAHVLRTAHLGKQRTRACIRLVAKAMQSKYSTYPAAGSSIDGTHLHGNATLAQTITDCRVVCAQPTNPTAWAQQQIAALWRLAYQTSFCVSMV